MSVFFSILLMFPSAFGEEKMGAKCKPGQEFVEAESSDKCAFKVLNGDACIEGIGGRRNQVSGDIKSFGGVCVKKTKDGGYSYSPAEALCPGGTVGISVGDKISYKLLAGDGSDLTIEFENEKDRKKFRQDQREVCVLGKTFRGHPTGKGCRGGFEKKSYGQKDGYVLKDTVRGRMVTVKFEEPLHEKIFNKTRAQRKPFHICAMPLDADPPGSHQYQYMSLPLLAPKGGGGGGDASGKR